MKVKKLIAVLVTAAMFLSAATGVFAAESKTVTHQAGVSAAQTDGDFTIEDGVLTQYNGSGGKVVIPDGVMGIGQKAFENCTSVTSVIIPDGVEFIYYAAFQGCTGLKSVSLPDSLGVIGWYAFAGCSSLTAIDIPDSVTDLGWCAFYDCSSLANVRLSDNIAGLGDGTFVNCTSLKSIKFPKKFTFLAELPFVGCTNLAKFEVAEGNEVCYVYEGNLYKNDPETGVKSFVKCPPAYKGKVTVQNGTEEISFNAFGDSPNVTAVTLPNTVKKIWSGAFQNNSAMTSIVIPDSVTEIASNAFWKCSKLASVSIGKNVQRIGSYAFADCKSLKSIEIPDSVTEIEWYLFENCSALSSVRLPKGMTSVSDHFFAGCKSLASVTIPSSVTEIGSNAFLDCTSLKSIKIPNGVTEIESKVFVNCKALQSVTIPASVTQTYWYMFENCPALKDIYFTGTKAQWQSITNSEIDEDGYIAFLGVPASVNVHYNANPSTIKVYVNPSDVTAQAGEDVTFSVNATGTGLTYQWLYKKAGDAAWNTWGTRRSSSTTATANASWDGMKVCCRMTDAYGNVLDSLSATITIDQPLMILTQSVNQTINLGESVSLSVSAQGKDLSYQWYYKKAGQSAYSKWNNRTHATETVTPNATWNGIQLYCEVSDSIGAKVSSSPVTITVKQPLQITQQPADQSVNLGDTITLSLKASGSGLTYQWYFKKAGQSTFSKWNNHTHASESVTPNATWNGIQLYCEVCDSTGAKVHSNTVKITVKQNLKITQQPTDQTVTLGNAIKLSVKAEGNGLTYQWYYKKAGQTSFTKWNGRTHASESVTPNATWNGIKLYCEIKDAAGISVRSNEATITVKQPLKITQQSGNQTIALGDTVKLSVVAQGEGLTYQWYFKKAGQTSWSKWNGRTHASESVTPNATWNGIQLYCEIKDSSGATVKSTVVQITVK